MGKTIIISAHILPELADMCSTIGIMQKGRLIMHGSVEDIQMKAMHARSLRMKVLTGTETAIRIMKEEPLVKKLSLMENEILCDFTGDDMQAALLLKKMMFEGVLIESYYREKGDLEALFLELTGDHGDRGEVYA